MGMAKLVLSAVLTVFPIALFPQQNASRNSEIYYNQASVKYQSRDFNGASEDLNKAIEADSNNIKAHYLRGSINLNETANYDLAIRDFSKCIRLQPDNIDSYFSRGIAYQMQKKYNDAIKDFSKCINMDSKNTDALFMRALGELALKNNKGAVNDYDAIIRLEGEVRPKIFKMATVYNNKAYSLVGLGRYTEALPVVTRALELDNTSAYIWDTRGEIYYNLNDFNNCIRDMDKAISISLGDNSFYIRGLAKIKLGRKEEGCQDLVKARELGKPEASEAIVKYCR